MSVAPLPTMRVLFALVAAEYGLTEDEMHLHRNFRRVSWPRQDFMWRCRQIKRLDGSHRYSFPQIGRFLGGMDHSSVQYGAKRHAARLVVADRLKVSVSQLRFIQKNRRLAA